MLIIVVAALALVAGSEAVSGPDAAPPFVLPGSISVSPVTSSPSLCIYSEKILTIITGFILQFRILNSSYSEVVFAIMIPVCNNLTFSIILCLNPSWIRDRFQSGLGYQHVLEPFHQPFQGPLHEPVPTAIMLGKWLSEKSSWIIFYLKILELWTSETVIKWYLLVGLFPSRDYLVVNQNYFCWHLGFAQTYIAAT